MAGKIVADTLEHSTAGSVTTDYVVEGSAKVWLNGTTAAVLNDSFNVSSGTDNGTGNYTYAFSNSMNNSNWSPTAMVTQNSTFILYMQTLATGSALVRGANDAGEQRDCANSVQITGDLA